MHGSKCFCHSLKNFQTTVYVFCWTYCKLPYTCIHNILILRFQYQAWSIVFYNHDKPVSALVFTCICEMQLTDNMFTTFKFAWGGGILVNIAKITQQSTGVDCTCFRSVHSGQITKLKCWKQAVFKEKPKYLIIISTGRFSVGEKQSKLILIDALLIITRPICISDLFDHYFHRTVPGRGEAE